MRTLIVGEDIHNYLTCYVKAFEKNGFETSTYRIDDSFNEVSFIKNAKRVELVVFIDYNFRKEIFSEQILEILKKNRIKLLLIYIDCIEKMQGKQHLELFDFICTFSPNDVKKISVYNKNVKYLPVGVDETVYCGESAPVYRDIDVLFVGSKSSNRLDFLEFIAKWCNRNYKSMQVYGHYWHNNNVIKEFISKVKFKLLYPELYPHIINNDIMPKNVSELYRRTKICLNIHIEKSGEVNARTFEICGNKNFQLVDRIKTLEELGFIDGINVAMFDNKYECVEKLNKYLKDEVSREKIAERASKFVNDKFTMSKLIRGALNEDGFI